MSNKFQKFVCFDHRTSTKRKGYVPTPRCPICSEDMIKVPVDRAIPPKDSNAEWDSLKKFVREYETAQSLANNISWESARRWEEESARRERKDNNK